MEIERPTGKDFTKMIVEHVSCNSNRRVINEIMCALVDEINAKVDLLEKLLGNLPFMHTVPDTARIKLAYDHILDSKVTIGELRRETSIFRVIPALPQQEWCEMETIHDFREMKKKKAI